MNPKSADELAEEQAEERFLKEDTQERHPSIIITGLLGQPQPVPRGFRAAVLTTLPAPCRNENSILTVKTAKGDVAVTLDGRSRDDKPAQAANLKPGVA